MSWHYLQGQEVASWEGDCLDGAPSALSRLLPTRDESSSRDSKTASSNLSPSGMMSALSTGTHGEAMSTSSAVGSHAKTSASQAQELALAAHALAYGGTWLESSVRFDRDSCSWKTHRCLFVEVLPTCSVTLPQWGMMRAGVCWERITSEHHISATAYGYSRSMQVQDYPAPGKWLPTPTAHNAKETACRSEYRRDTPTLATRVGGKLNPQWVEWLMGWPVNWTDCEPLETDRFRQWLQLHGAYYSTTC